MFKESIHTSIDPIFFTLQGLLDVLCFASKSRGDSEEALSSMLVGLICTSTVSELDRRADALTRRKGSEGRCRLYMYWISVDDTMKV